MAWRVDDTWTLRQNRRWQKSKVSYQTMYGWPPLLGADDRTVNRVYYVSKPEVTIWSADHKAEARFNTGALRHTPPVGKVGRATVRTPDTNAQLVYRIPLEKKKKPQSYSGEHIILDYQLTHTR